MAPSFDEVDLRASFTDRSNRFTIIAYAKNLADNTGFDNAFGVQQAGLTVAQSYGLTPPRTFGLELQYRFR